MTRIYFFFEKKVICPVINAFNEAQKHAARMKNFDPEVLWSFVNYANTGGPPGMQSIYILSFFSLVIPDCDQQKSWGLEVKSRLAIVKAPDGKLHVHNVWQVAEVRTALAMAQHLKPGVQFYENLRLQHSTCIAASGCHLTHVAMNFIFLILQRCQDHSARENLPG
jgi:hypothetical protein